MKTQITQRQSAPRLQTNRNKQHPSPKEAFEFEGLPQTKGSAERNEQLGLRLPQQQEKESTQARMDLDLHYTPFQGG
uniref:Uncharacterized protein n=1 Tax=Arundo donax TaxID=35708 RepID=A0A0A8Z6L0_ARUDO